MSSQPLNELLSAAQNSGLVSAAQAAQLTQEISADESATREDIAAELVNRKLLSSFQAELLLAGRGDEAIVAGRYRLLDKLGQGGMGAVYKAQDTRLDRLVAIKVLPPEFVQDADAVARFEREARALAKLSHPNIVQAHDCGEDRGRHFLVMEFVEGVSLTDLLRQQRRIAPTIAADYIHQAALGLQHAHARGLIHRDIKPSNLLLATGHGSGNGPRVVSYGLIKILDLGLARFLQDQIAAPNVTREGTGMGTPDYMAPEQFSDAHHADARSDIYALGCTLYHLLTGRVPFPGSSLSEKWQAHAEKDAPPLEEICPEAPAGLMLVVQRMMAKHPAERFQTAAEVADALAPYVAGSSPSLGRIKATLSWKGGQLTSTNVRRTRGLKRIVASALAVTAISLVVALSLLPRGRSLNETGRLEGESGTGSTGENLDGAPQSTVVTIENGLTVAKDERIGQFTSINAALEKAKPGMTIRVLDNATYTETILLGSESQHSGITLEAIAGATLEINAPGGTGIRIVGVPNVTVRGFRLRAESMSTILVKVETSAPGLLLERLDMEAGAGTDYDGIILAGLNHAAEQPPAVIKACTLRRAKMGIVVAGMPPVVAKSEKYDDPVPCQRVIIQDNSLVGFATAIRVVGASSQVHVVGNRMWGGSRFSAIQLEHLQQDSKEILIANNTILESIPAFRLWDDGVRGDVRICNNLVLGAQGPDMAFIDNGGLPFEAKGPGDGAQIAKHWKMSHNWREVKEPKGKDVSSLAWIPPDKKDVRQDEIPVLSRQPDHADFLRPAKESSLATAGIGGDLAPYVGAIPPEGTPAWDWSWTWDVQVDKQLTVSKIVADGGRFRTITEALEKVQPGMTIKVLDDHEYDEAVVIDMPARHARIRLEAVRQATLLLSKGRTRALTVRGVPGALVRGFRFRDRDSTNKSSFVLLQGETPGVVLEKLKLEGTSQAWGISVQHLRNGPTMEPLRIRNCEIKMASEEVPGIVVGVSGVAVGTSPCSGMVIEGNHISGGQKGIVLEGEIDRVLVAGNVLTHCTLAGLEMMYPAGKGEHVLFANNTVFRCGCALRLWDRPANNSAIPVRVQVKGNVFLEADFFDLGYFLSEPNQPPKMGDSKLFYSTWRFSHNWRDSSGSYRAAVLPLAAGDKELDPTHLVSRTPGSAGFMRPKTDSPLAREGAGKGEPYLPPYAGALPPEGQPAWDWQNTWRAMKEWKS